MEEVWSVFWIYTSTFAVAILGCYMADLKTGTNVAALIKQKKQELLLCASRFNSKVKSLERSYKQELDSHYHQPTIFSRLTNSSKEDIRRSYEAQYMRDRADFALQVKEVLSGWDAQNVVNRSISKTWKLVIVVGLIAQMAACSYSIINTEIAQEANKPVDEAWTAQSIPMPHMTDGSRYVSNPDGIISPQTEALMNKQLKKLDDELGIESAVIIVKHLKDQDIFRFAQDIFDIYKVGKRTEDWFLF